ncbi:hypothetical protein TCDM_01322 [Trypanosoma cruzi Dm28c]|uniref:Uncharacterized protein n=1 Tax=Trypanosoma cruzi Dm28c TaxID=1416333 RepID=V5BPY0_TRYCR|nr:hypothetical protein TCDM_01322 [Trypanosoma cruzi Dm28c]
MKQFFCLPACIFIYVPVCLCFFFFLLFHTFAGGKEGRLRKREGRENKIKCGFVGVFVEWGLPRLPAADDEL